MNDTFKAFVEFLSNILAALAEFLGWTISVDDLIPTDSTEPTPTEAPTAAPVA